MSKLLVELDWAVDHELEDKYWRENIYDKMALNDYKKDPTNRKVAETKLGYQFMLVGEVHLDRFGEDYMREVLGCTEKEIDEVGKDYEQSMKIKEGEWNMTFVPKSKKETTH